MPCVRTVFCSTKHRTRNIKSKNQAKWKIIKKNSNCLLGDIKQNLCLTYSILTKFNKIATLSPLLQSFDVQMFNDNSARLPLEKALD